MTHISGRNAAVAGLAAGIVSAALFLTGAFEPLEIKVYDYWLRSLPPVAPPPELALLEIPADRTSPLALAAVVSDLDEAGAAAIVLHEAPAQGPGMELLTRAMVAHGNVIVAARFTDEDIRRLRAGVSPKDPPSAGPGLDAAASGIAFGERVRAPDGILRRFTPQVEDIPEIGYATAAITLDNVSLPKHAPIVGEHRSFGPGPRFFIPFRHLTRPARVDLEMVASGDVDLGGKTVLVTSGARTWLTPIGDLSDPMVTFQIASSILDDRGISRAPAWMVVAAVLAVAAGMSVGVNKPNPLLEIAMPLAVGALVWFLAGLSLRNGTWVDVVPVFAAMSLQVVTIFGLRSVVGRSAPASEKLMDVVTYTFMNACIAESACLWVRDGDRFQPMVRFGDVPSHLTAALPQEGIKEVRRDEGNIIGASLAPLLDGGIVVVRPHSALLTEKRLELLRRILGEAMAAASGDGSKDKVRAFLMGIAAAVDENDHFPPDRSRRVGDIAAAIASRAGLSDAQVNALMEAAHLHDIGKVGVHDRIIDSTMRLSDEDYARVKRHAELSARILERAGARPELIEAVRDHHEPWDGKGYPNKLSGEEIPIESRILAVADAAVSLTSDRPYRRGTSLSAALLEIASQRGRMFDPRIVEAILEVGIEEPGLFGVSKTVV